MRNPSLVHKLFNLLHTFYLIQIRNPLIILGELVQFLQLAQLLQQTIANRGPGLEREVRIGIFVANQPSAAVSCGSISFKL
jgi:hypothetical protein